MTQKNRDKIRERNKKWHQENKNKERERHRKYRQENKDKINKEAKKYRQKNRNKIINQYYIKKHNISLNKKIKLLEQQNWQCYICKKIIDVNNGHIDHCHKTKKIRGILCGSCNRALGLFQDNIKLLKKAINYLQQF